MAVAEQVADQTELETFIYKVRFSFFLCRWNLTRIISKTRFRCHSRSSHRATSPEKNRPSDWAIQRPPCRPPPHVPRAGRRRPRAARPRPRPPPAQATGCHSSAAMLELECARAATLPAVLPCLPPDTMRWPPLHSPRAGRGAAPPTGSPWRTRTEEDDATPAARPPRAAGSHTRPSSRRPGYFQNSV